MLSRLANPEPSPCQGEGVETGWAAPKGLRVYGEGTVQTTNVREDGGESRSGMNPGAVGSNPAADATLSDCHQ